MAAVVVLGLAIGAYVYLFKSVNQHSAQVLPTHSEAKKEVENLPYNGDKSIQTNYLSYLKADRKDDAQRYIDQLVDKAV